MATTAHPPVTLTRRGQKSVSLQRERWKRRGPLLPALIFTIIVTQLPFIITLVYSFFSWNLLRTEGRHFAWFENYSRVLSDPATRSALWVTVELTAGAVILSLLVGLGCALLVDRKFLGRGVVRTLLIAPFLVMPAAAALLWKTTMLNPVFGIVNWVLSPLGVGDVDWASQYPLLTIIVVETWHWAPFMMLILLGGLQSQDRSILEAARVEGAGAFQIFRYLTLPHLRQYIELGIVLGSIYIVQTFDSIFMITQGGPGTSTTNLPFALYLKAFRAFNVGQAAALGVIVVILTILVATVALRVVSRIFQDEGVSSRVIDVAAFRRREKAATSFQRREKEATS
ncbi:carbohydrate ABC transporter permease [Candidatus Solirubrobacter pratensis]|uniref:carbohydrate ABC transporter permease n=1 Tax=Candidatus Solirubrobacter pratensis TaxID=1298857 RepID=UPI000406E5C7|nr:sugar ABC transporter permease [Candidatus Solirubrobacter pratensis]